MLSNLPLEIFRPSRRCRASPCSWVRYWNTSSAADSSIWPSSSVINSTSSCIESNCVRVMAVSPAGTTAFFISAESSHGGPKRSSAGAGRMSETFASVMDSSQSRWYSSSLTVPFTPI